MGAVEAEVAGGELADADAAEDAGEVLRVEALFLAFDGDEDDAGTEAERGLDGIGEAGTALGWGVAVAAVARLGLPLSTAAVSPLTNPL